MGLKKILVLLTTALIILAAIPAYSAQSVDLSERIIVTDLCFKSRGIEINEIPANEKVSVECNIERTDMGEGNQDFVIVMQIFDKGRLSQFKTVKGTAIKGLPKSPYGIESDTLGANTSDYEIVVVILADLIDFIPLAEPVNFKSGECSLNSIKIGNDYVDLIKGVYEYNMDIVVLEDEYPAKVTVRPKDLSTKVLVSNITGNSGTLTIDTLSHDNMNGLHYSINLNVTPVRKASIKHIYLDGVKYDGFKPNEYELFISMPYGVAEPPKITCEPMFNGTSVSVEDAKSVPGVARIVSTASDGSESEYTVKFAKTIRVTPDFIGHKQVYSATFTLWNINEPMPATFAGSPGNYNEKSMQLNSYNNDYNHGTRWGYFNFTPSIPYDSVITNAALSVSYRRGVADKLPKTSIEVFKSKDYDWVTNTAKYKENVYPLPETPRLHIEDTPTTDVTGTIYTANILLDKDRLQDKSFNFAVRQKEVSSGYDYTYVNLSQNYMPVLTVSYYSDKVDDGYNTDLNGIYIDGTLYPEFDPEIEEYTIITDLNQTVVPQITCSPVFDTTSCVIENAISLPGVSTVTVTSRLGAIKTYRFTFAKTIELTPNVMADKKTGEAVFNFYGSPSSFPYSLNLISNSPIYSVNTRTMFVNFENPLPEDAQIINAQIKLRAIATGTPKYIDILNCLSTDWVDNPAKYNDAGEYPLVEETALNADDDVLVEVGTFSTWSYYTFDLNPQMLNAASDFNLNIRSRTVSGDYFCPQVNGNGIPKLTIIYK